MYDSPHVIFVRTILGFSPVVVCFLFGPVPCTYILRGHIYFTVVSPALLLRQVGRACSTTFTYLSPELLADSLRGFEGKCTLAGLVGLTSQPSLETNMIKQRGRPLNSQTSDQYMRGVQWKKRLRGRTSEYLSPCSSKGKVVKVKRNGSITTCKGNCQKGG